MQNQLPRPTRILSVLVVAAVALFAVYGRATSKGASDAHAASAGSHQVNVGLSKPITVKGSKLKIAMLSLGNTDPDLLAENDAAVKAAKADGASLTVLNSGLNPTTQDSQLSSVLSSGQYNAILVQAIAGQELCTDLTKQAPAKGIEVVAISQPICNTAPLGPTQQWVKGIVASYQNSSPPFYVQEIEHALKSHPNITRVAAIYGPALSADTVEFETAIKDLQKKDPKLTVEATYNGDYSQPNGLQLTQGLLQAHPTVQAIFTQAPGDADGAAEAIKDAGDTGKVVVIDSSGAKTVMPYVKDGLVLSSAVQTPKAEAQWGVGALVAAFEGKKLPHGRSGSADYVNGHINYLTKSDLATYVAPY
jgi:ribose transport system substrate-binding protein